MLGVSATMKMHPTTN